MKKFEASLSLSPLFSHLSRLPFNSSISGKNCLEMNGNLMVNRFLIGMGGGGREAESGLARLQTVGGGGGGEAKSQLKPRKKEILHARPGPPHEKKKVQFRAF